LNWLVDPYFLAETIGLAIPRRLPDTEAMDQLIVTGGGHRNGMLLGEVSRLAKRPLSQTTGIKA
jgi:1,6-anhydro-N-acetylmuramate kinase